MASNKETISKGIKFLIVALLLMFIGPFIISIGFRAMNDGNYIFLIIGIIIGIIAIVAGFKGVRTILAGLFDNEN